MIEINQNNHQTEYKEYGYSDTEHTYSHNYIFEPILKELNNLNKNSTILDLGCGNGALVNKLISLGFDAYGTDASEQGIALAKVKNKDRFYVQDLNSKELPIELANHHFNTIISTEVIEHLYAPREFIEFAVNILKKSNGTLIISTPYNGYLKNLALSIFDHWDTHLDPLWDGGHIKFWSKKTLIKLLSEYGFKDFKFIGCGRAPYLWKSMIIVAKF